jgi:hypothetical protein
LIDRDPRALLEPGPVALVRTSSVMTSP